MQSLLNPHLLLKPMNMKKNNYLLPFSILFALGIAGKAQAQEALKMDAATAATSDTKGSISTGFMALEGRVIDAQGNGVANATVTIKGTNRTTQADANGNYRFAELQAGNYTVVVSREGYESGEINISLNLPNMKVEQAKVYSTPNTKSINASPLIRDIVLRQTAV